MKKHMVAMTAPGLVVLSTMAAAQVAQERASLNLLEQGRLAFAGYGDVTYVDAEDEDSAFRTKLAPLVLVQLNDRIHIEAEMEISVDEAGETETELEYGNLHYFLGDSATVTAGKFLLPFGQFGQNLHPSWINKLPSIPVIYGGHDGNGIATPLMPVLADIGAGAQKTFVFNNGSRLFLDAYVVNGPSGGHDESEEPVDDHGDELALEVDDDGHGEEEAPQDDHGQIELPEVDLEGRGGDNNNDKAFGGRLAYAWLPKYEAGLSYYQGAYDDNGQLEFSATGVDVNYTGTYLTIRGEYIETESEGLDEEDGQIESFTRDGWYLQASWYLRQTGIDALAPWEVVAQWSEVNKFEASERWALGVNYWLTPSVPIKFSIDRTTLEDGLDETRVFVQMAYAF